MPTIHTLPFAKPPPMLHAHTELRAFEDRRASVASEQTLSPYASANFDDLDPTDDHPTIVAYVLAVNDHCARLYHFDHVRTGDRTAMHKATFEETAVAAGTWTSSAHGPALTVVSTSGTVSTYALPSAFHLSVSLEQMIPGCGSCWRECCMGICMAVDLPFARTLASLHAQHRFDLGQLGQHDCLDGLAVG